MDAAAEEGNIRKVEMWHIIAVCLQRGSYRGPSSSVAIYPSTNCAIIP